MIAMAAMIYAEAEVAKKAEAGTALAGNGTAPAGIDTIDLCAILYQQCYFYLIPSACQQYTIYCPHT
ncbi:hypothetical protein TSUD_355490 [Trifolium subterraneum]|uniref:Uncharacterized protein n=1 Tax=Trifolium subterraneum TaxID=3900 RepID=A0A2Z6MMB1_TRISU|nr:hypothetical protein TSUD_355490 [Trifolium subterraneum]